MRAKRGAVFLHEDTDWIDDAALYTATFSGHHELDDDVAAHIESATPDEAIAWARERADQIWITVGDGPTRYAAGSSSDEAELRWPPPHPLQRRRPRGQEWRDRTPQSPPIAWFVLIDLSPPADEPSLDRDALVERIATRAGAGRWEHTTLELPDGDADEDGEAGWFSYAPLESGLRDPRHMALLPAAEPGDDFQGYDLTTFHFEVEVWAATADEAMRSGVRRCGTPRRWAAVAWAHPLSSHPDVTPSSESR